MAALKWTAVTTVAHQGSLTGGSGMLAPASALAVRRSVTAAAAATSLPGEPTAAALVPAVGSAAVTGSGTRPGTFRRAPAGGTAAVTATAPVIVTVAVIVTVTVTVTVIVIVIVTARAPCVAGAVLLRRGKTERTPPAPAANEAMPTVTVTTPVWRQWRPQAKRRWNRRRGHRVAGAAL